MRFGRRSPDDRRRVVEHPNSHAEFKPWNRAKLLMCLSFLPALSCSNLYDMIAVEHDSTFAFQPKDDKGSGCLSDFSVSDNSGAVVWRISTETYIPPPCENRFPIVYGIVPKGMNEEITPAQLKPGTTYKMHAWDGDGYSGSFRFRRGLIIENLGRY